MVSWLVGGAVYLAQAIEYSVQIGRTYSSSLEWLLPMTGCGASESGIDCRILIFVAVNAAFVLVAPRPAIVVLDIRTARVFAEVVAAELRGLGRQHLVVAHTCPGSYQGMRLPGPPNSQLILLVSC